MKVLVACEFSGTVRDAFLRLGHDAWSCDLLPTESPGPHVRGDVLDLIGPDNEWDLMVAHPPCTHLARSGAAWFRGKGGLQEEALDFVLALMNAPIPQIAIENPPGVIGTRIRKADQTVQPYWFGNPIQKTTQFWLKGLPALKPTSFVKPELVHYPSGPRSAAMEVSASRDRGRERSRTPPGLAAAMAEQWGAAKGYSWRSRTGCRLPGYHEKRPV